MPTSSTLRHASFAKRAAALRSRASAGDAEAWWELGCLLKDGEVDGRGAIPVPPDHRGAFLAFRRGAEAGDDGALLNLGVCYDHATGTRRNRAKAWRCYHRLWRKTQQYTAANNLATWHRDGGNQRLAFSWYQKAADAGDGDAHVALAYAYYYGLGTTTSLARALRELDRAGRSNTITSFGREEALYLRAVARLDRGRRGDIVAATSLLRRAAADGDYPEADAVLTDIGRNRIPTPCRCRRHLAHTVKGQAQCPLHRSRHRRSAR
jgi:TPR repeat protein